MSPSDTESANGGTSTISSSCPEVRKNRVELMDHVDEGVVYLEGGKEAIRNIVLYSGFCFLNIKADG